MFKALLGGGMREGKEDQVEIQDVRAPVFRALLHFAYTDALPEARAELLYAVHACSSRVHRLCLASPATKP